MSINELGLDYLYLADSNNNELYNLHATNPYRHISCHR